MSNNRETAWERVLAAQMMEAELYVIGQRAGAVAAVAEWPHVQRLRPQITSKAFRATQELFGRDGAARGAGYSRGWVDGYNQRCRDLDWQRR
jgi:hypothetical protein